MTAIGAGYLAPDTNPKLISRPQSKGNYRTERAGRYTQVRMAPPRPGDVRHSLADLTRARESLGYAPSVDLAEGLREYVTWAKEEAAR